MPRMRCHQCGAMVKDTEAHSHPESDGFAMSRDIACVDADLEELQGEMKALTELVRAAGLMPAPAPGEQD